MYICPLQKFNVTIIFSPIKVIKEGLALEDLGLKDGARPVQHAELQIGDKLVRLRSGSCHFDRSCNDKFSVEF